MKTKTYRTIDGETVTLEIPETPEEEAEIQRKMRSGEIDDGHGFADGKAERRKG